MRQRLRADLVAAQAEIFLVNGDINSNLYTSTRAMHSAIIGLLQVASLAFSLPSCVSGCFGKPTGHHDTSVKIFQKHKKARRRMSWLLRLAGSRGAY